MKAGVSRDSQGPPALPRRVPLPAPVFRVLPGTPKSAKAARTLTRELLGAGHPTAHTVMLLVSELVTNSVLHSRSGLPGGTVTVALSRGSAGVLIQVRDDGGPCEPLLPADRMPAETDPREASSGRGRWLGGQAAANRENDADSAEHGYGLVLVAALADTWGTVATREGRVTWCRLAADPLHEQTSDDAEHSAAPRKRVHRDCRRPTRDPAGSERCPVDVTGKPS